MLFEVMLQSACAEGRVGRESENPMPGRATLNEEQNRWEAEIDSLSTLQDMALGFDVGCFEIYFPDPRDKSDDLPIIKVQD